MPAIFPLSSGSCVNDGQTSVKRLLCAGPGLLESGSIAAPVILQGAEIENQ